MQVEDVTLVCQHLDCKEESHSGSDGARVTYRVSLTAGRAAEQERHLTVGYCLTTQIIVDDQSVLAVVSEPLCDGRSCVIYDQHILRKSKGRLIRYWMQWRAGLGDSRQQTVLRDVGAILVRSPVSRTGQMLAPGGRRVSRQVCRKLFGGFFGDVLGGSLGGLQGDSRGGFVGDSLGRSLSQGVGDFSYGKFVDGPTCCRSANGPKPGHGTDFDHTYPIANRLAKATRLKTNGFTTYL